MAENDRLGWPEGKFGDDDRTLPAPRKAHHLDSPEMRELHAKLLTWFYTERDLQADNRAEAAFEYAARLGYDGVELMVWAESVSQDLDAVARLSAELAAGVRAGRTAAPGRPARSPA